MRKLLIYSVLVFARILCNNSFAQEKQKYQVFINLHLSDCSNCILPIKFFSQINQQLSPKIVLRTNDKRVAISYLKKYCSLTIDEKDIIYSDSLFNYFNSHSHEKNSNSLSNSMVFVVFMSEIIASYPLIDFNPLFLSGLENITIEKQKILPDSIVLGRDISIQTDKKSNLLIFDRMFSKLYLIKYKHQKFQILQGSDFDKKVLYEKVYEDTKNYYAEVYKFQEEIRNVGKEQPQIVGATINEKGNIMVFVVFYTAQKLKGEILIIPNNIIIEVDWEGKLINYITLPNNSTILPFLGIYLDETLRGYTVLNHLEPDTSKAFIGELFLTSKRDKKDKQIQLKQNTALKFPAFAIETKTNYLFLNGYIYPPYYFFTFANLVGNIKTGEISPVIKNYPFENNYINLIQDLRNFHNSIYYQLVSVLPLDKKKSEFLLLVKLKESLYLCQINLFQNREVEKVKILLPKLFQSEIVISNYILIEKNKIFAVSSNNELLTFSF